jgi:hypothetical protein
MGVEIAVGALTQAPGDMDIEGEGRESHAIRILALSVR